MHVYAMDIEILQKNTIVKNVRNMHLQSQNFYI